MARDGSLVNDPGRFAFDLETQKGVMHLLASVRASDISTEQKNELRDLAFLYINGGKDQSVRITLEQKVSTAGVVPIPGGPTKKEDPVSKRSGFGSSRPAPTFSPAAVTKKSSSQPPATGQSEVAPTSPPPAPVAKESEDIKPPVVEVSEVVAEPEPAPVQTTQPEEKVAEESTTPTPIPAPTITPAPAPVEPTPIPEPISTEPVPVVKTASQPTSAPSTPPQEEQPAVAYDSAQALQRVRQIKALVNEQVGNPVNLVDIDNAVGREYMSALLEAMKKINSGSSTISAMQRLEQAYQAVEEVLKNHDAAKAEVEEEDSGISVNSVAEPVLAAKIKVPESLADPKLTRLPVTEIDRAEEQPNALPEIPVPAPNEAEELVPTTEPSSEYKDGAEEVVNEVEEVEAEPAEEEEEDIVETVPRPDPAPAPEPPAEEKTKKPVAAIPAGAPAPMPSVRKQISGVESAWGPSTDGVKASTGKVSSLAQTDQKLRSPGELPSAAEVETSGVSGDPLYTKEVDDGLQQLLLEWSFFKKSGLFGTGPKGREHPLFKKVAGLQIPLLLAGRFEGATQEIKQSITDYMNGWRYEQGIIYEQGETFEHYLRRVIRHILDLQKNNRSS